MTTKNFIETAFPNLKGSQWTITSSADRSYNCIAWAVGLVDEYWWPSAQSDWPNGVPIEETVDAFVAAFATKQFEPCDNGALEDGYEKIALYKIIRPTHAASQLPSGDWTSKLGKGYDIQHSTPEAVAGAVYGSVVLFLKRKRPDGAA